MRYHIPIPEVGVSTLFNNLDTFMSPQKQKALINFKKTQSLLKRLIKMVEDNDYCIDIMQQNMAAVGLLKSAHQSLMEGHLNSCFISAMSSKNDKIKHQKIEEILTVTKLVNK